MYVNGSPRYENQPVYGTFSQYEPVKMVQGVKDTGRNSFSFSNVLLRADMSGSTYKSWNSSISSSFSRHGIYGSNFTVYSQVPLSAILR